MSDIDVTLLGDEELMKVLTSLDYKLQQKTLKRVVSDSANPMVKEIRKRVGPDSSPIRRSGDTPPWRNGKARAFLR